MRIAVIGAGRMGAIRAEDLVADPRVDEVLIANRRGARAAELAERLGATAIAWTDLDDLSRLGVDGTVVALATDAHGGALEGALATGRPVLCEKPIALTLEDTESVMALAERQGTTLVIGFQRRFDPGIRALHEQIALTLEDTESVMALAERHGTTLVIGFQRRFDPGIRALHDQIASGGLGVLYSMSLLSHDIAPSGPEFIAGSGGIFRDLHVHDFDVIRWLTGSDIDTVYATRAVREHRAYADFDDADTAVIHVVTASGVQAVVRGARHNALGHDVRVEVHGSKDSAVAGLTSRTPLHAMDGTLALDIDPYAGFVDRFRSAFRHETAAFVSVVEGTSPNPCGPEAALESLRVAIACERSAATGAPIRVGDVHATRAGA